MIDYSCNVNTRDDETQTAVLKSGRGMLQSKYYSGSVIGDAAKCDSHEA